MKQKQYILKQIAQYFEEKSKTMLMQNLGGGGGGGGGQTRCIMGNVEVARSQDQFKHRSTHTTSALWPVLYASAQPYNPGSVPVVGNGQL